jgi:hypothetical protein
MVGMRSKRKSWQGVYPGAYEELRQLGWVGWGGLRVIFVVGFFSIWYHAKYDVERWSAPRNAVSAGRRKLGQVLCPKKE